MTSAFANSQFAYYDTSYPLRTNYITTTEYQNAPQALDLMNLLPGGNPAVQLQALQETIGRASSWVDQYTCGAWGSLCATQNSENARIWASRNDGTLRIHTKYWPILSVDAFSFSPVGSPFSAAASIVPSGNVWIEPMEFVVNPFGSSSWSTVGINGYGYGTWGSAYGECYCSWVYTNGWPNTTLAASVAAGATSIQPLDVTGIYPGTMLTLYDLPNDEAIQVSASYSVGASVVPFANPLQYSHNTTATITNLPPAIKQAAIWATSAMIKQRGSGALEVSDMGAVTHIGSDSPQNSGSDWWRAEELLLPFRQNFVSY